VGVLTVMIVSVVALAVTWRLRVLAYSLPIVWGLIGVFAAEQSRNGTLAFTALIAALVVLVGAVLIILSERRRVERS